MTWFGIASAIVCAHIYEFMIDRFMLYFRVSRTFHPELVGDDVA